MKFIFIKRANTQKSVDLVNVRVGKDTDILELSVNTKLLEKRLNKLTTKSLYKKVVYKLFAIKFDNALKNMMKKACQNDKDIYFVFPKAIKDDKGIIGYLLGLKLSKDLKAYSYLGEMKDNIYKYIEEYAKTNEKELHTLKCLIICKDAKELDFKILENMIKDYKIVNIYSKEETNSHFINKMTNINEKEGTTVDIIKKGRKSFLEYDICIFYDEERSQFPRLRFSNKALVVNLTDIDNDKYDSNILKLQKRLSTGEINQEKLEGLYSSYGKGVVASIISNLST